MQGLGRRADSSGKNHQRSKKDEELAGARFRAGASWCWTGQKPRDASLKIEEKASSCCADSTRVEVGVLVSAQGCD